MCADGGADMRGVRRAHRHRIGVGEEERQGQCVGHRETTGREGGEDEGQIGDPRAGEIVLTRRRTHLAGREHLDVHHAAGLFPQAVGPVVQLGIDLVLRRQVVRKLQLPVLCPGDVRHCQARRCGDNETASGKLHVPLPWLAALAMYAGAADFSAEPHTLSSRRCGSAIAFPRHATCWSGRISA